MLDVCLITYLSDCNHYCCMHRYCAFVVSINIWVSECTMIYWTNGYGVGKGRGEKLFTRSHRWHAIVAEMDLELLVVALIAIYPSSQQRWAVLHFLSGLQGTVLIFGVVSISCNESRKGPKTYCYFLLYSFTKNIIWNKIKIRSLEHWGLDQ